MPPLGAPPDDLIFASGAVDGGLTTHSPHSRPVDFSEHVTDTVCLGLQKLIAPGQLWQTTEDIIGEEGRDVFKGRWVRPKTEGLGRLENRVESDV